MKENKAITCSICDSETRSSSRRAKLVGWVFVDNPKINACKDCVLFALGRLMKDRENRDKVFEEMKGE